MFLGGAGAAVALPLLRSVLPRSARAGALERPVRMLAYYVPNGIHMQAFTPATSGADYALTPMLQPLANVRDSVLVLTGLANNPARPDGPGDHAAGTGSFITATHVYKTEGADIRNGISLDQVAANALGSATRFPSLQLGTHGGSSSGGCDSGYSCAYSRNISWAGPTSPLPKTVNPQAAFDLLFAGFDPDASAEEQETRRRRKLSVLDSVLADVHALEPKLGASDREKLDEYFTGIRAIETRLQEPFAPLCEIGERPGSDPSFPDKARIMADLIVLAFQCDLTRIASFMLGNAGSGQSFSFIGVGEAHHQISHHQGVQENYDKLQTIGTWELGELAYLLEKMQAVDEGDGTTMLDNSMVFFSSEISDGNAHNHNNMPIVLAGSAGGALSSGRHVIYDGQPPVANLFISMLRAMGVDIDAFGDDSTGPLDGLS
jgi:hypothetical protein